jgi:hypothetical protein
MQKIDFKTDHSSGEPRAKLYIPTQNGHPKIDTIRHLFSAKGFQEPECYEEQGNIVLFINYREDEQGCRPKDAKLIDALEILKKGAFELTLVAKQRLRADFNSLRETIDTVTVVAIEEGATIETYLDAYQSVFVGLESYFDSDINQSVREEELSHHSHSRLTVKPKLEEVVKQANQARINKLNPTLREWVEKGINALPPIETTSTNDDKQTNKPKSEISSLALNVAEKPVSATLVAPNRYGLFKNVKKDTEDKIGIFGQDIQEGLYLGEAKGEGDCFYDACAQALNAVFATDKYTIKFLRVLCHNYLVELNRRCNADRKHPNWIHKQFNGNDLNYLHYFANVRYTAEEKKAGMGLGDEDIAIWGEPHIDGRIICEQLGVKLHVFAVQDNPDDETNQKQKFIPIHNLVDNKGLKNVDIDKINWDDEKTIHIAVCNNHFVPIQRKTSHQNNAPVKEHNNYTQMMKDSEIETLLSYVENSTNPAVTEKFNTMLKKYCASANPALYEIGETLCVIAVLAILTSIALLSITTFPAIAAALVAKTAIDTLFVAGCISSVVGATTFIAGIGLTIWARPDASGCALQAVQQEVNPENCEFDSYDFS